MKKYLASFIPQKIPNSTVLRFLEFLRSLHRVFHRTGKANPISDSDWKAHEQTILCSHGYIEDQHRWNDCRFGAVTVSYAGCEVIALYNALLFLQKKAPSFSGLLKDFEKDGMLLNGRFGTSPVALNDYLCNCGYRAEMTACPEKFNSLANQSSCLILSYYNDGHDIMAKVHTICITRDKNGYLAHNAFGNGSLFGPYASFDSLLSSLNNGRARALSLTGIKKNTGY